MRKKIEEYRKVQCPDCNGYGHKKNESGLIIQCMRCSGRGFIYQFISKKHYIKE